MHLRLGFFLSLDHEVFLFKGKEACLARMRAKFICRPSPELKSNECVVATSLPVCYWVTSYRVVTLSLLVLAPYPRIFG
jgi:hypothetical protein